MKWIVLAILVVIVPYTWVTFHYRKPGKAFEPYGDLKKQANVKRLLSAGFHRVALVAERPADLGPTSVVTGARAATAATPGGIPDVLGQALLETPHLPNRVAGLIAAPTANRLLAYTLQFTAGLPDNRESLHSAHLYSKDNELFILVHFEPLPGELLSRTKESVVRLTIPAGALESGNYQAILVGTGNSVSWPLQVN